MLNELERLAERSTDGAERFGQSADHGEDGIGPLSILPGWRRYRVPLYETVGRRARKKSAHSSGVTKTRRECSSAISGIGLLSCRSQLGKQYPLGLLTMVTLVPSPIDMTRTPVTGASPQVGIEDMNQSPSCGCGAR